MRDAAGVRVSVDVGDGVRVREGVSVIVAEGVSVGADIVGIGVQYGEAV
ncbi:MAG TPA: hypothetical protein VHL11_05325 [Phototrophicaceae bacterium]|nr:hypothetical protein [Phototrophicaceae bacterium]